MARISGIELQDNWKVGYALTKIKGIGWSLSNRIVKETKVGEAKRISDLSVDEISKLTTKVESNLIEGELARTVRGNIQRLKQIGTYRGIRHASSLPSRGQRTKTNARTKRGKRRTVGAYKKEALVKMQKSKPDTKGD